MDVTTSSTAIARAAAIQWYQKNRVRTAQLFDLLTDEAYYAQPISLRHPIVFYEGHLPAFSLNTLVKKALHRPGLDEHLERLFARGIDPDEASDASGKPFAWPERGRVKEFVAAADALVLDALAHADLEVTGDPLLDRSDAVFTILEHEAMHQETLLYMWHRLPFEQKRRPDYYRVVGTGTGTLPGTGGGNTHDEVMVPAGAARLGATRGEIPFGWDNEFGSVDLAVESFAIDRRNVTNADFLAFVNDGGYRRSELWTSDDWQWLQEHRVLHPAFWERDGESWQWRGMFERFPLPPEWPVYVSYAEASAYARWRRRRLPTEAEFDRAAFGSPTGDARRFPWGNDAPTAAHGVFDFTTWDPQPVGSHPRGRSAWGIDDLVGNGWEWTSSIFRPFPGFAASASYPEYSADFFDESHYVMKGGSPATAQELLRPTFRNWFRPRYPYVYATFRTVREDL
ncbi:MAG TPA: SUMF1/EgtB/PvdO family nonheme iron enzyme [Vicinamibacterales bacterium]|nr:SUMF1/EgtB/PvdO family nonheme iron enzyme [Vicinamibacterales bacterium]